MNIIQILGRVGRKPETRFTQSGLKVTSFSLAVNVKKGGQEETVWWRVTVWGDRFDKMLAFVDKGSALIVIGEMAKPNIYTDKNGTPQVGLEMTADIIRFVPSSNPEGRQAQDGHSTHQAANATPGYASPQPQHHGAPKDNFGDFESSEAFGSFGQPGTAPRYASNAQSDDQLPF